VPFLELRIGLVEQLEGTWEKIKEAPLKPKHFNFSFNPHVSTRAIFQQEKYCATFDIHVTETLLREIGIDYKGLDKFFKKIKSSQPAELSAFPHKCPTDMIDKILFILNNPYSLKSQTNFLDSNIRDIITIALETMASPNHPLPIKLTNQDKEGLHAIRQFIEDSCPDWPNYKQLRQKGGLNEFKMKVGFKHLFKMTTYEYHMELKFREAKKLLAKKEESISSIAYKIGYVHHQSFTKEFTSRFKYSPIWYQENFHRINDDDDFLLSIM
jgi:AraC-like DNA-binding protein